METGCRKRAEALTAPESGRASQRGKRQRMSDVPKVVVCFFWLPWRLPVSPNTHPPYEPVGICTTSPACAVHVSLIVALLRRYQSHHFPAVSD